MNTHQDEPSSQAPGTIRLVPCRGSAFVWFSVIPVSARSLAPPLTRTAFRRLFWPGTALDRVFACSSRLPITNGPGIKPDKRCFGVRHTRGGGVP